ncbi:MAG: quinolinate synthase NadA [Methanoregulaceae archaeon]|nr:quinolinate synthase NadA [Methanoregulaceae archaeon]
MDTSSRKNGGVVILDYNYQLPNERWCRLNALYPEKTFYTKDEAVSDDMKKNTLNDVFHDSDTLQYKILLNLEVISQARVAIKRMIAFGRCHLDGS